MGKPVMWAVRLNCSFGSARSPAVRAVAAHTRVDPQPVGADGLWSVRGGVARRESAVAASRRFGSGASARGWVPLPRYAMSQPEAAAWRRGLGAGVVAGTMWSSSCREVSCRPVRTGPRAWMVRVRPRRVQARWARRRTAVLAQLRKVTAVRSTMRWSVVGSVVAVVMRASCQGCSVARSMRPWAAMVVVWPVRWVVMVRVRWACSWGLRGNLRAMVVPPGVGIRCSGGGGGGKGCRVVV